MQQRPHGPQPVQQQRPQGPQQHHASQPTQQRPQVPQQRAAQPIQQRPPVPQSMQQGPPSHPQIQQRPEFSRPLAQGGALRPPSRASAGGQGTLGRPIKLHANHFEIKLKSAVVFHYDVDVKPMPAKTLFR